MSVHFSAIKKSLRFSHDEHDEEIEFNINACIHELERVGINTNSDDALIQKCCELYCKAEFNFNNCSERYMAAFEKMRDALSLSTDYTGGKTEKI